MVVTADVRVTAVRNLADTSQTRCSLVLILHRHPLPHRQDQRYIAYSAYLHCVELRRSLRDAHLQSTTNNSTNTR